MKCFCALRAVPVRIRFCLACLSVLCLVSGLSAEARQAKPKQEQQQVHPMQMNLPGDLKITWYQWETPDQIFLQYSQEGFPRTYTGRMNIQTGKFTPLGIPGRYVSFIDSLSWQVSPDHRWLTGEGDEDKRSVLELNGSRRLERPLYGLGVRWAPNSLGWIEWKDTGEAILAMASSFSDGTKEGKSPEVEYTLPKETRIIGFTAPKTVLFVSTDYPGPYKTYPYRDWTAQSLALGRTPPLQDPWKLRIPNLIGIEEGAISPDLKEVCWLAVCSNLTPQHPSYNKRGTVNASIWISEINGNNLRRVVTIPLPEHSVYSYQAPLVPGPDLPHNIQWVPGKHKVSYEWDLRIWTVPLVAKQVSIGAVKKTDHSQKQTVSNSSAVLLAVLRKEH